MGIDYGIRINENPRFKRYLIGKSVEFEAYINHSKFADFLRLNNIRYVNGKNMILYEGEWREITDDDLRLIILKAIPPKDNGYPYYINEKSIKKTIKMWKQGWESHPEDLEFKPDKYW